MDTKRKIILIPFLIYTSILLMGKDIEISGYYKEIFTIFQPVNIIQGENSSPYGIASNHLRLNLHYSFSDIAKFDISYDLIPKIEIQSETTSIFESFNKGSSPYRAYDVNEILFPENFENSGGNFAIYQNLDRAYFTLRLKFADIYTGRQAISWGSGKVINPTDVISPYLFNELEREEKSGVDAIRIRMPIGSLSEIDGGYISGKRFTFGKSAFFLRSRLYLFDTDISFLLFGFQKNLLLGFDLSRTAGGAGIWLETSWVKTNVYSRVANGNSDEYLRLSSGMDYDFKGLYMFLEYHYNGAGTNEPRLYPLLFSKVAYTTGGVYLLGKHYICLGTSYQITGLLSNTNMVIYNATDNSMSVSIQMEYNPEEDIYISAGGFISLGKAPYYNENTKNIELRSEFGYYPDVFFTSFKMYF